MLGDFDRGNYSREETIRGNTVFFIFFILVYFDVDSVIAPISVVATLEFNFGPFQGT